MIFFRIRNWLRQLLLLEIPDSCHHHYCSPMEIDVSYSSHAQREPQECFQRPKLAYAASIDEYYRYNKSNKTVLANRWQHKPIVFSHVCPGHRIFAIRVFLECAMSEPSLYIRQIQFCESIYKRYDPCCATHVCFYYFACISCQYRF